MISRRLFVAGSAAASTCASLDSWSMGRLPVGGRLVLHLPWHTGHVDPHELSDPLAAIIAGAIAEPVFGRDRAGRVYPTLAQGWPTVVAGETIVELRQGLRSAKGRPLLGRDLAWSVARARKRGASGLASPMSRFVRADPKRPLVVRFGKIAPDDLARRLSSPLLALLPRGFRASSPDGSGPFIATCGARTLVLKRNQRAARGPSLLQELTIHAAPDLATSLRAFEAGEDSLGWLGGGFHQRRRKARPFTFGSVGWIVLATGRLAARLNAPGVAQTLANAVPVGQLHLGLSRKESADSSAKWNGGPTTLIYPKQAAHLQMIAAATAAKLSQPGHEIEAKPLSPKRFRKARQDGDFALAVDVVRDPQIGPVGALIALATADSAALGRAIARHPPRHLGQRIGHLTRTLRIGVLGEFAIKGAVAQGIMLSAERSGHGIDWGSSYRG